MLISDSLSDLYMKLFHFYFFTVWSCLNDTFREKLIGQEVPIKRSSFQDLNLFGYENI